MNMEQQEKAFVIASCAIRAEAEARETKKLKK